MTSDASHSLKRFSREIIDDMSEHAAHDDGDVDGIKKVKYLEAPNAKDGERTRKI